MLDRALLLCFPGPASATGEDLAELHLHGSRAVVAAVEAALAGMPELRRAEPGEFTRRALANGRIDLAEAEGLADLLAAETQSQRIAALAAAEGAIGRQIGAWTERLLRASAGIEAAIEFAEEGDVAAEDRLIDDTRAAVAELAAELRGALDNPPAERLRDGIRVVLAGPPNSGKSSLFNVLAGREAAIVSPIAGTTRDIIEAPVVRDGVAWLLVDVAGLHDASDDPVERIGIERARAAAAAADVVLWLGDTAPPAFGVATLSLHARADLGRSGAAGRLRVSAATGEGVAALWVALGEAAQALLPQLDRTVFNRRQASAVAEALEALDQATPLDDPLLLAEQLRLARGALDRVTGASGTEAMLDQLFGRFCIGK